MNAIPKERMTAEEFVAWEESVPGRYELVDGQIFAQAAERAAHAKIKGEVFAALREAIRRDGLPCRALPDGMAVRISARTVFEPDAQVYCGPELPDDALLSENPIIVVEVISPSTGRNDALRKLEGYFRLPSVRHYLILSPDEPLVIHHARGEGETIATRIFRSGVIALDPPGLKLDLTEIYGGAPPEDAA
jgi:Uma2 family endonuclease